MEKLLAALSLPQVGEIKLSDVSEGTDNECLFTIELNSRIYTLKAKSRDEAKLWVETLVKLRDQGIAMTRYSAVNANGDKMQTFGIDSTSSTPSNNGGNGKSKLLSDTTNATWIKSGKICSTWCCFFN